MVRISGGQHRGHVVQVPVGHDVRPTTGRVREAVFSILGERLSGAWIWDLFAGSGLLGLEALSRGAAKAAFVDLSPVACTTVQHNVGRLRWQDLATVIQGSAIHDATLTRIEHFFQCRHQGEKNSSIVFLDPPYHRNLIPETLSALEAVSCIIPGSLAVVEHEAGASLKDFSAWEPLQYRSYGDTRISIFVKTDGKK
ncbi:MAG: 16S rRNA (guanine(966)-N(2))-methyltransferase RsmD [Magnetococcales bacterium]|nr:16S rRNA (guanine(966)-N(2))-methyltransferase RsmD [Magnetococcales bacterium]